MKSVIPSLIILFFIVLIITMYVGIISCLIYFLSLIPILNITINNWFSLFTFSLCIILWVVPYIFINIFQAIPLKNKFLKRLIILISELISVLLFTLYMLFLDKHFVNLSFSNSGIIIIIITILVLSKIINIAGQKIKDEDTKKVQ